MIYYAKRQHRENIFVSKTFPQFLIESTLPGGVVTESAPNILNAQAPGTHRQGQCKYMGGASIPEGALI